MCGFVVEILKGGIRKQRKATEDAVDKLLASHHQTDTYLYWFSEESCLLSPKQTSHLELSSFSLTSLKEDKVHLLQCTCRFKNLQLNLAGNRHPSNGNNDYNINHNNNHKFHQILHNLNKKLIYRKSSLWRSCYHESKMDEHFFNKLMIKHTNTRRCVCKNHAMAHQLPCCLY